LESAKSRAGTKALISVVCKSLTILVSLEAGLP
jgi:hypothetical protein